MSVNNMQFKSFGILLIDFIENEKKVSVENTFKELCELKEPHRRRGIHIGVGGSILVTNYGKVTEVTIPPEFERVELSLVQESRFITDIYCYGILKKERIEEAESNPQEVRSLIDRAQNNLEEFIKSHINGIFSKNELDGGSFLPIRILHIDPEITNPFKFKMVENKLVLDEESINRWIRDNNLFLNVLGFNTHALMSRDNLSLTSRISIWGDYRSGFVVVSFHGGTGEKYLHPTHFTSVRDILKMIRMFYWSNLRSKQMDLNRNVMESFYQRLKSIKKGKSIAELPKKLDEVNTAYSNILEWQVDLLSLLARVKDEIEHFEGHLHNLNVIYDFEGRLSTMKTTSEEDAILFASSRMTTPSFAEKMRRVLYLPESSPPNP
jgi:hypothetical protein